MTSRINRLGGSVATRFRRRALQVWESHGGGFYGFVALLTFLYLETLDLAGDLAGITLDTLGIGWVLQFLIGNLVDAVRIAIQAALWPLAWLDRFGIGLESGALLLLAYGAYRLVRPTVLRLLREPGPEPDTAPPEPDGGG